MKTLIILITVLSGFCSSAFGSDKSHKEEVGDKHYTVYAFEKAITSYLDVKHLSSEGQRRLAESYRNLNQNVKAEDAYAKLVGTQEGVLPEDYYEYAMVLKANGKYEPSNQWMNKFASLRPGDLRAQDYIANKSTFGDISKDDGKYSIVQMNINTDAQDLGTSYYNGKIVFASSRSNKISPRKYNWNGLPFLNIYVSELDKNQLKEPVMFDKDLNSKMHDGPASFNKAGTFMAYTKNNGDTKRRDRVVGLHIFFRNYENGKWSEPVPFALNKPEYSVGHPCLSADGKTMYFSSDMPGGFGGADIYKVRRSESGEWGTAVNLGKNINTEGDELFPFFQEDNQVLFFASNGRFGLGGLDVFICPTNGSEFGHVINAGAPLNTTSDDFAVIVDDKMKVGYFSSNRVGGKGDDDIYSFDILKDLGLGKKIMGIAKNKSGNPIPGTLITLLDTKGVVLETRTADGEGAYTFLTDANQEYKITGKKAGYEDGFTGVNTFGPEYIIYADVTLLNREEQIVQEIQVGADLGKILKFNPIYFDLDKYNIRAEAEVELDKIVTIMNKYPNMVVELRSYADCRATVNYNQALSDKRAKASADYIKKRITKPGRISGKGFSESKLVNDCSCDGEIVSGCSEEQHQMNRRTEFIIIQK